MKRETSCALLPLVGKEEALSSFCSLTMVQPDSTALMSDIRRILCASSSGWPAGGARQAARASRGHHLCLLNASGASNGGYSA